MVTGKKRLGPVGAERLGIGGQRSKVRGPRSEVGDRIGERLRVPTSDLRLPTSGLTSDLGLSDPTIGCGNWRLLAQALARWREQER
jgi:hypothetical protein